MSCGHCAGARRASVLAAKAFATGDIRLGATRAKEASGHLMAKLKGEPHADATTAAPTNGTAQQAGDKAPGG